MTAQRRPEAEHHPAGLEEADLLVGLLCGVPAWLVGGLAYSLWIGKKINLPVPEEMLAVASEESPESWEDKPSIGLVEDPSVGVSGPLWVRGGIPVVSSDGVQYEPRNRTTLCRCGASRNKPFCDGTHAAIGFDDGLAGPDRQLAS